MKIGLHSHHFNFLNCQKFYFVILFSFVLLGILFLMSCCFQINLFYFKTKVLFSKDPFEKSILKIIHLESLELKSHFLKTICNHFLIGLHPSQFSMKILVLNKTQIKACGPK